MIEIFLSIGIGLLIIFTVYVLIEIAKLHEKEKNRTLEKIGNSKIDNCYIDNTISKINSIDNNKQGYELQNLAGVTYVLNGGTVDLKVETKKRKRKPKLRKSKWN